MHALRESEVAFVGEGSVDELGSVTLVLVGVGKLCVNHTQ